MTRSRQFAIHSAASTLLLLAFAEAVVGGKNATEIALIISLGIPGLWLLLRGLRRFIRKFRGVDLFSPWGAFPIAYVVWFGFGSLNLFDEADSLPYGYFVLGLVSYLLGAFLFRSGKTEGLLTSESRFQNVWDPSWRWKVVALLGIVTACSYFYLIARIGIPVLSTDAGELRGEVVKYGIAKAILLTGSWTLFVFLALQRWNDGTSGKLKSLALVLMSITAILLASLGNRGFVVVPILVIVVARHYVWRRLRLGTLILAGIPLFVGISLYGFVRDNLLSRGFLEYGKEGDPFAYVFPFVSAYTYIRNTVVTFGEIVPLFPGKVPFQHGTLSLGALIQVLPGHHESSDMFFRRLLGNEYTGGGQPATLLGPLYGDFGVTGIIAGMFLFGALYSKAYTWMLRRPTLFHAVIYAWLVQTALLGLFGSLFTYIITLWIPIFWALLSWLMNRRDIGEGDVVREPGFAAPCA